MWLLILIISIKLQMPAWYWSIFTIITIIRPILWVVEKCLENEIKKSVREITTNE